MPLQSYLPSDISSSVVAAVARTTADVAWRVCGQITKGMKKEPAVLANRGYLRRSGQIHADTDGETRGPGVRAEDAMTAIHIPPRFSANFFAARVRTVSTPKDMTLCLQLCFSASWSKVTPCGRPSEHKVTRGNGALQPSPTGRAARYSKARLRSGVEMACRTAGPVTATVPRSFQRFECFKCKVTQCLRSPQPLRHLS